MIKVGNILVFIGNGETTFYLVIGFNLFFEIEGQIPVPGIQLISLDPDNIKLFNTRLKPFENWISSSKYNSWSLLSE